MNAMASAFAMRALPWNLNAGSKPALIHFQTVFGLTVRTSASAKKVSTPDTIEPRAARPRRRRDLCREFATITAGKLAHGRPENANGRHSRRPLRFRCNQLMKSGRGERI